MHDIGTIIVAAIALGLLIGFVVFYRYSRTPEWRRSDVRRATAEFLVVISPMFGGRFKPPRPEPPAVTTPKDDSDQEVIRTDPQKR